MEDAFKIALYAVPPLINIVIPIFTALKRKAKKGIVTILLVVNVFAGAFTVIDCRSAEIFLANKYIPGFTTKWKTKETVHGGYRQSLPTAQTSEYEVPVYPGNLHGSFIPYIRSVSMTLVFSSLLISFCIVGIRADRNKQKEVEEEDE